VLEGFGLSIRVREHHAQVVISLGEGRLQPDRGLQLGHVVARAPGNFQQGKRLLIMGFRAVGFVPEFLQVGTGGLVRPASLGGRSSGTPRLW
jgi:hypothetical protein